MRVTRRWRRTGGIKTWFFTGLVAVCGACGDKAIDPRCEVVMGPGMQIIGTNANGTVTIMASAGARRTYSNGTWRRALVLTERSSRWNGSFGLYDPGAGSSMYGRLLAEEGRIYCQSVSEAMRWLKVGSEQMIPRYTNTGLVFGYSRVEPKHGGEPTRSIAVWQLYIKGRRPSGLPGADDMAVRVSGGAIPDTSAPGSVPVGLKMMLSDSEYIAH